MNTVLTDAGDMMRGGRAARTRASDGGTVGGSALETARRNLVKELNRLRVDDSEALARQFSGDDRVRFVYMPLFAQVLRNIVAHAGSGYQGDQYVTEVGQEYLESMVDPILSAGKKGGLWSATAEDRTLMRYRLLSAFVRYNRFATEVLERGR